MKSSVRGLWIAAVLLLLVMYAPQGMQIQGKGVTDDADFLHIYLRGVLPGGNHTFYYVSPDSSSTDWEAAKNPDTPCTAQTAMENAMPGDVVLFRGGLYDLGYNTYGSHAVLEPAHSGEPENPIIFMAYPGEVPILNGHILVKVEGIADAGSNNTVLVDNDVNFTQAGVQSWDIVRTVDKPGGAPVEGEVTDHTVHLSTEDVHNSIDLQPGDRYTIGMDIVTVLGNGYQSHIIFDGFVIEANNGTEMPRLLVRGADTNNFVENITVRNCTIIGGKRLIVHGDNREGLRIEDTYNVTVQNCLIYGQRQIDGWHNTGAIKMYHNRNTTIENCEIYNTILAIYDKSDSYHSVFRNNYIHDVDRGILFTGYAWNTTQYFVSNHINAEVYNNVIAFTKYAAISDVEEEWARSDGMKIYKNTLYTGNTTEYHTGIGLNGGTKEVYDNIICGFPKDYDVGILKFIAGRYENGTYYDLKILSSDHNLFPDMPGSFCVRTVKPDPDNHSQLIYTTYWNLNDWKNSGELYNGSNPGACSIVASPGFMNISGTMRILDDFRLRDDSPAKGAGRNGGDMGADIDKVGIKKRSMGRIRINSDEELRSFVSSNMLAGNGTSNDPYVIENYDIDAMGGTGIFVGNTTLHLVVRSVEIYNSSVGADFYHHGAGIEIFNCTNITIVGSVLRYNYEGIYIRGSRGIRVVSNRIEESEMYGINISGGGLHLIYGNSFLYNHGSSESFDPSHVQARDDSSESMWNISHKGNYWSDWTTPDNNYDGIVDNPYVLDGTAGSRDYYPLTESSEIPEISVYVAPIFIITLVIILRGVRR